MNEIAGPLRAFTGSSSLFEFPSKECRDGGVDIARLRPRKGASELLPPKGPNGFRLSCMRSTETCVSPNSLKRRGFLDFLSRAMDKGHGVVFRRSWPEQNPAKPKRRRWRPWCAALRNRSQARLGPYRTEKRNPSFQRRKRLHGPPLNDNPTVA